MQQGPSLETPVIAEETKVLEVPGAKTLTPTEELESLINAFKEMEVKSTQAPKPPTGWFSYFSAPQPTTPSSEELAKVKNELEGWKKLQETDKSGMSGENFDKFRGKLETKIPAVINKHDATLQNIEERYFTQQSQEKIAKDCDLSNEDTSKKGTVTTFLEKEKKPKVGDPQNKFAQKLHGYYEQVKKHCPEEVAVQKAHEQSLRRIRKVGI